MRVYVCMCVCGGGGVCVCAYVCVTAWEPNQSGSHSFTDKYLGKPQIVRPCVVTVSLDTI